MMATVHRIESLSLFHIEVFVYSRFLLMQNLPILKPRKIYPCPTLKSQLTFTLLIPQGK